MPVIWRLPERAAAKAIQAAAAVIPAAAVGEMAGAGAACLFTCCSDWCLSTR